MAIQHPLLRKALGLLGAVGSSLWRATIDWRAIYFDPTVDPVHPRHRGRYVYACWHEYLLMPIVLRGDRRMLALASRSGDGAIIAEAMHHLGWSLTRGSTSSGSVSALLNFLRADNRHPNVTPDGPRGPRRTMAMGPIFMASKLGLPIACVGYAYDRPWRLQSWDRFALPRPFTRGRAVFGPPLRVPPRVDRKGMERYRLWFERLLNWLTEEAEAWAESGKRRPGEAPMLRRQAPPALREWDPALAPTLPHDLARAWEELTGQPVLPARRAA